jgi:hypothetical protein
MGAALMKKSNKWLCGAFFMIILAANSGYVYSYRGGSFFDLVTALTFCLLFLFCAVKVKEAEDKEQGRTGPAECDICKKPIPSKSDVLCEECFKKMARKHWNKGGD